MDYAADVWARLLAKTRERGAAITFSDFEAGSYNETTDTFDSPSGDTVTGRAVEVPGDPEEYKTLELIQLSPVTLIFAPDTMGQKPEAGFTFTWASEKRTVKYVFPYRPNGVALGARVLAV